MANWSTIPFRSVGLDRLDAEHFHPDYLSSERAVEAVEHRRLDALATYIKRGTQPEYDENGSIPVLRSVNVQSGSLSVTRQEFVTPTFFAANPRGHVKQGDVLINSTGLGTLGRAAHLEGDERYFADGHVTIVRGLSEIDPFFLTAVLISRTGQQLLIRRQRGSSGQVELYPDDIASIPVPIPSPAVREIIEAIGKRRTIALAEARRCYSQADALIANALGLSSLLLPTTKTYTAPFKVAVLAERLDAEHFRPQYRTARDYLVERYGGKSLADLGRVLKGVTPVEYTDRGVPVVRSGDLVDLDDTSGLLRADPTSVRFFLRPGDVLISSIGAGSIGKVQVFDHPTPHTTVSEVTVLRQDRLNPHLLKAFLSSPLGQLQIESWVTGATGQLHLRPADVEKIIVPTALPGRIGESFEQLHREARARREEAAALLEQAKQKVEDLIRGV